MRTWVKWLFFGSILLAGFGFALEIHWMVNVSLVSIIAGVILGVYYAGKGKDL